MCPQKNQRSVSIPIRSAFLPIYYVNKGIDLRLLDKLEFDRQFCAAPKPPSDEGGGFAARRRRRERQLPLSQKSEIFASSPDKGSLRALMRQYNFLTNWNWRRLHLPLPMGEVAHKVGRRGHFPSQSCPVGMPAYPKGRAKGRSKDEEKFKLSNRLTINIVGAAIRRPQDGNPSPYTHSTNWNLINRDYFRNRMHQ